MCTVLRTRSVDVLAIITLQCTSCYASLVLLQRTGEAVFNMSRTLTKAVTSVWQDEGVGASVRRSVGRPEVSYFSETTALQLEMIQLSNMAKL